jgi:DNA-binding winged helix-turn-helix (wHTH) protein/tetratricopeptide (TPR) repeat protein
MTVKRVSLEGQALRFGEFHLDRAGGHLRRGDTELPLRGKSLALLRYLVEQACRRVTRDELLRAIWPGVSVSPSVVRISVSEARAALGDDPLTPRFIETVGRRGYRFAAEAAGGPDSRAHFVGRNAELTRLHALLGRCSAQRRQMIFVSGEPGIGKTALVERFAADVRGAGLGLVAQGQCVDLHGSTEPYLPVLELLGRLCRDAEGVVGILERWAPSWLLQMPAIVSASTAQVLRRRVPSPTRERMLREFADAMDALTRSSQVVVVLEDLHWSDVSTLDLLTYLAERTTPARLLVIGTYRPVDAVLRSHELRRTIRELIARGRAIEESLELLAPADIDTYLGRLLTGAPVDPRLAEAMHAKTDGNPLFLVAIVEHLLERGSLTVIDGQWRLGIGHDSLPPSLRELVAREIETLDADEQRILAAASVVGSDFDAISVAAAAELPQRAVEKTCAHLAEEHQLISATGTTSWPDGSGGGTYRFLHSLHRDAVYGRLPAAERLRLHRAVGGIFEGRWTREPTSMAAVLASHFEQGADWRRAVRHRVAAVEAAKARLADADVMVHAEAALALLERLPASRERDEIDMTCSLELGAALLAVRGYGVPEVMPRFARARDLAIALEQPLVEFVARGGLHTAEMLGGDQRRALVLAWELLAMAERVPLPPFVMIGHTTVGTSHYKLGSLAEARAHFEQARAAWQPDFPRLQLDQKVLFLGLGALVLMNLGEQAQADASIDALIEYQAPLDDPLDVAGACDVLAAYRNWTGNREDGCRWAERSLELAIEHGFPVQGALAKIHKGNALGDLSLQREGFGALQSIGYRADMSVYRLHMAETLIAGRRWDEARTEVDHALADIEATGEARHLPEAHRLRARCLRAARRRAQAAAALCEAIAIARQQQSVFFERRALADRARFAS